MSQLLEIKVPDIGDFKDVPVIEVMVKPGDAVKVDDPLVTLESDKATMDVPSAAAGVVRELKVKVGDKVSEGMLVLTLAAAETLTTKDTKDTKKDDGPFSEPLGAPGGMQPAAAAPSLAEVKVPDIGDFKDVPVIEVLVKPGDAVKADDPLVTLESDKATMDVPAPAAGVVQELKVKVGDKVSEGALVLVMVTGPDAAAKAAPSKHVEPSEESIAAPLPSQMPVPTPAELAPVIAGGHKAHASPSVRRFARELGVDVGKVRGTGLKGRITQQDVQNFVKGVMTEVAAGAGPAAPAAGGVTGGGTLNLLPWPQVDFAKFGPIETKPLSRINKLSAANLARNWVMIPAVTFHEDADITELEAFRVQFNKENEKAGVKVTMLAFLIKACVAALKRFPEFNSSLDGDNLVLKQYYHVGFAADTPNGLVVPVVKDADKKGVVEIATETAALATKARGGKLGPAEMQGACFTISSLGGIGGTAFAPIINAPEVAILGVNKSAMKPVWNGREFVPRLILPLSLTADHRVIDGAAATRFNVHVAELLADMRRVLM